MPEATFAKVSQAYWTAYVFVFGECEESPNTTIFARKSFEAARPWSVANGNRV